MTDVMLDIACDKAVYTALVVADVTRQLTFGVGFEVMCSADVFSHGPVLLGHLPAMREPEVLTELRVHTVNGLAYDALDYGEMLESWKDTGVLRCATMSQSSTT